MTAIRLDKFDNTNYKDLISWIDNEEALMQFAGPLFKFPLTPEQLDDSLNDKNRIAFRVVNHQTDLSIGHCEIYISENSVKLGRILIGDKEQRGKGMGRQIVNLLLDFTFYKLNKTVAELNVFDWNVGAIKCYERVGFSINPGKKQERKIKDQIWTALNMTIDKSIYEEGKKTVAAGALEPGGLAV
ncbi:MAG: GNAT family N-acetyltransferase [Rhizobacter sp.]|nr:GNAT family N-acetyltransferase [Ferruginibacter sp.]